MEFAASFSGGKDSILAIKKMIDKGNRLVALIVSSKKNENISWTHNLSIDYFREISKILRCNLILTDSEIDDYEEKFETALSEALKLGATQCVFGDIDIKEHIIWNNTRCDNVGIQAIHPLLFKDRKDVVDEFLNTGLRAEIVKVSQDMSDKHMYIGKILDWNIIKKMHAEYGIDMCGENGEYHTVVKPESVKEVMGGTIYTDNASTCFPKAPGVSSTLASFTDNSSFSINRGSYIKAYELMSSVIDVRYKILDFLNTGKNTQCIFTPGATISMNMVLRGLVSTPKKIFVYPGVHNSLWRTVEDLRESGSDIVYCIDNNINNIDENCDIVVATMVDNIFGTDNSEICRNIGIKTREVYKNTGKKIFFIVDAVQSVCEREIDFTQIGCDALIVTAHIGFMGPEGIAALILKDDLAESLTPIVTGGTGSKSDSFKMPDVLPDRLEAGTLNTPGIIAWGKAIDYINHEGVEKIIEKKHALSSLLKNRLENIEALKVFGNGSFIFIETDDNITDIDESYISFLLDSEKSIMTRVGIQCSCMVHKQFSTFPRGGIRISMGYFNNVYDVDTIYNSLVEIEQNQ